MDSKAKLVLGFLFVCILLSSLCTEKKEIIGSTTTTNTIIETDRDSGVPCGGWDQGGRVVCDCEGRLEKSACPLGAVCDSGQDICYGECGDCRCDGGNGVERPCNGLDLAFTDICSRKLSGSPADEEKTVCEKSGGVIRCGNGWCACACPCAKEGEYTKVLDVVGGYRECCEGLKKVKTEYSASVGSNGECRQEPDEALEVYICTKCGDGACGLGENKCNCPQDCLEDGRTCNEKCRDKGYSGGYCNTWAVSPEGFKHAGCKSGEVGIGWTSDCTLKTKGSQEPIVGVGKECCCIK